MDNVLIITATALFSYFIGAIPFGYLAGRWRGVDIVKHGSGNIGASNVGRVLGWRFGIVVFLLDFMKGAVPAAVGLALGARQQIEPPAALGVTAGLAAFVGHLFPVYLGFRGGKGVATGAGVVTVLLPVPTLAALSAWFVILCVSRYMSLASLVAVAVLCGTYFALTAEPFGHDQLILSLFCLVATTLVVVKHRANIGRLVRGNENRLSDSEIMRLVARMIHVLALGLWFGMAVFFSFPVALTLFGSFETLAESNERPTWFPLPPEYQIVPKMQKEQGTRAAGFAISPLFGHYFLWQGICGFAATVTALGWTRAEPGRRVHKVRALVLLLALTTVLLGWPIERIVSELRVVRNAASDELLQTATVETGATTQAHNQFEKARQEFFQWHLWSLLLNMVTILLVAIAMALTAQLPCEHPVSPGKGPEIRAS
jgi:acyl phosphate:glycerol-3-phosphate acyltransferase